MWIRCFVLASETGTSTTLSLKSMTLTTPLANETFKPYDLTKELSSASKSREIPDPLNLSLWDLSKLPNPANLSLRLLYLSSKAL